jgi:GrpB-like predicted nucleotidyltransferase (UPF0157 family)
VADTEQPIDAFLVGGPEHREILLVPYDSSWPALYETQRDRLQAALGSAAVRIDHIGSTAVPGLVAKPIIDVLVVVGDVEDEAAFLPALEAVGFVVRVREPGHLMLRTADLGVHVHLYSEGAPAVERYLAFRDRLRLSGADRDRYAATKRELAARDWPTMNHYAEAKTGVIQQILDHGLAAAQAGHPPPAVDVGEAGASGTASPGGRRGRRGQS